jgi:hypothetical protein
MPSPYDDFIPKRLKSDPGEPEPEPKFDPVDRILAELDPDFSLIESEEQMVQRTRKLHPQYNPATGRIEIKSVSHLHEAIMNWMLLNPGLPMKYCAKEFGVSQAWLSTLKNSHLFAAKLQEKQEALDSEVRQRVVGLNEKLHGIAEMSVERLSEMVEQTKDPKLLLDVTDRVLHRLGYGQKPSAPGQGAHIGEQNNFYVTSSQELAQARAKIRGNVVEIVQPQPKLGEK